MCHVQGLNPLKSRGYFHQDLLPGSQFQVNYLNPLKSRGYFHDMNRCLKPDGMLSQSPKKSGLFPPANLASL